jgi:hypothetical protein
MKISIFYAQRSDKNIFSIYTNLDFSNLSRTLIRLNGNSYIFGSGNCVCFIIDRMTELRHMQWQTSLDHSAIWTMADYESCLRDNLQWVLSSGRRSDLEIFREVAIQTADVADAINNGAISVCEYCNMLDEAKKFRDWAGEVEDGALASAYLKSVQRAP